MQPAVVVYLLMLCVLLVLLLMPDAYFLVNQLEQLVILFVKLVVFRVLWALSLTHATVAQ